MATTYKRWTRKEINLMRAMRAAGATNAQIAAELGRTPTSVQVKFSKLKHKVNARPAGDVPERANKPWTEDENRTLKGLIQTKHDIKEMAQALARTPHAIRSQINALEKRAQEVRETLEKPFIEAPEPTVTVEYKPVAETTEAPSWFKRMIGSMIGVKWEGRQVDK